MKLERRKGRDYKALSIPEKNFALGPETTWERRVDARFDLHIITYIWLKCGYKRLGGRGDNRWARFKALETSYKLQYSRSEVCHVIFKYQKERTLAVPNDLTDYSV